MLPGPRLSRVYRQRGAFSPSNKDGRLLGAAIYAPSLEETQLLDRVSNFAYI